MPSQNLNFHGTTAACENRGEVKLNDYCAMAGFIAAAIAWSSYRTCMLHYQRATQEVSATCEGPAFGHGLGSVAWSYQVWLHLRSGVQRRMEGQCKVGVWRGVLHCRLPGLHSSEANMIQTHRFVRL